jgi:hypothetical protein
MSAVIQEEVGTKFVEMDLRGKLDREDYKKFVPELETLIKNRGKLRLLVHMHDFDGWTAGGVFEELKFDVKHFNDFERVAIVGDKKWEQRMSHISKPLTKAEVRFFPEAMKLEAQAWLNA